MEGKPLGKGVVHRLTRNVRRCQYASEQPWTREQASLGEGLQEGLVQDEISQYGRSPDEGRMEAVSAVRESDLGLAHDVRRGRIRGAGRHP